MANEKKKRRLWLWIPLGLIAFIVVIAAIAGDDDTATVAPVETSTETGTEELSEEERNALVEDANDAYNNENYEEALIHYKKLINSGDTDGIIRYRYAYSKLQTGEFDINAYLSAYNLLEEQNPEHKYTNYAAATLIEKTPSFDYRKGMLGDYKEGTVFSITGEVDQIFQDTDAMLFTKKDEFMGYIDDRVWLAFESKPRILEGDVITAVCKYEGTKKYKTVLGSENKVPYLENVVYKIVEE